MASDNGKEAAIRWLMRIQEIVYSFKVKIAKTNFALFSEPLSTYTYNSKYYR